MAPSTIRIPTGIRALVLATMALAVARPAAAAVQVAVSPPTVNVGPGQEFDVTLSIVQAGSAFNGFVAVVGYDTTALTFVPAAILASQQGCLMTGGCSAACGNTFHRFTPAGDSLTITDHLLCDQIALTGPGAIYTLRFKAANVPQVTWIRLRRATFYNAGLFVTPVETADAVIGIGVTLGVPEGPPRPAGLRVRAEPNPARGRLALAIETDRAGELRADIHDVSGRLVRRLDAGWREAGAVRLPWDGSDLAGARVPPGVYLVTVRVSGRSAGARFAIVE
ncbi:MAG: hypothetical protein IT347_01690 [Candidatus Eisenbacteria bacterium]|nr:hypothetical protein [Candidatus Eisenbacteria bacterium]